MSEKFEEKSYQEQYHIVLSHKLYSSAVLEIGKPLRRKDPSALPMCLKFEVQ